MFLWRILRQAYIRCISPQTACLLNCNPAAISFPPVQDFPDIACQVNISDEIYHRRVDTTTGALAGKRISMAWQTRETDRVRSRKEQQKHIANRVSAKRIIGRLPDVCFGLV